MNIYKVTIVIPMLFAEARREATIPLLPPGSFVECLAELDEPFTISHWSINVFSGQIECFLTDSDWIPDDKANDEDDETIRQWLEREGFVVTDYKLARS